MSTHVCLSTDTLYWSNTLYCAQCLNRKCPAFANENVKAYRQQSPFRCYPYYNEHKTCINNSGASIPQTGRSEPY